MRVTALGKWRRSLERRTRLSIGLAVLGCVISAGALAATGECRPAANGPPFCLLGTETAPDLRLALVQELDVFGLTRLRTGDVVQSWKIVEVGRGWISAQHEGRTVRMSIGAGLGEVVTDASAPKPAPKLQQHGWAERGDTE